MFFLKKIIRKIMFKNKASGREYISYLRQKGMTIGEDVILYAPTKIEIDEQYPWMVKIGNHVRITQGVTFLTHDYSWSVIKGISGAIYGNAKPVKIGNNVFIGMNSMILGGTEIGDNVIIGAGSVVSKKCESNSVYAGNPAKRIMGIDEFIEKRKNKQYEEAKVLAREYYRCYQKMPSADVFHEFFMLFDDKAGLETFDKKMSLCDNYQLSLDYLKNNKPMFQTFEEFIDSCFKEKE